MGWDFARVVPEPAGGRAGPAGAPILLQLCWNLLEGVLGQQDPGSASKYVSQGTFSSRVPGCLPSLSHMGFMTSSRVHGISLPHGMHGVIPHQACTASTAFSQPPSATRGRLSEVNNSPVSLQVLFLSQL
eukprot:1159378-Pelagomonas_calceolata.AAC.7